jgi:hypothetical protein
VDVQNKILENEQRLFEIDEGRQRRLSEASALQEAAAQRRKAMEQERLERLEQIRLKEKSIEEELQRQNEMKKEKELKKKAKLERIYAKKMEMEEEKRRSQAIIMAKLEMGAQRKDENLRKVREKAAAANQNAKIVAHRVRQNKDTCPSPSFGTIPLADEQPINKSRLKKLKTKILALSKVHSIPLLSKLELNPERERIRNSIRSLNKKVYKFSLHDSQGKCNVEIDLARNALVTEKGFLVQEIRDSKFFERIIDAVHSQLGQSNFDITAYLPLVDFILEFVRSTQTDYMILNESACLLKVLDSLALLIPFCIPGKENDSLTQLSITYLTILNTTVSQVMQKQFVEEANEIISSLLQYFKLM